MNILYVDDDLYTRDAIKLVLRDKVEHIFFASDGEMGEILFQEQHIDVVLTDILMPKVNGIELAKSIRAHKKDVKIVAITASLGSDIEADELTSLFDFILKKPISPEELIGLIQKL